MAAVMGTCDGAYTLGILTVANALANVDVNMLGAFENFIIDDLRMGDAEFGVLMGPAFIVTFSLGSLAFALVSPRVGMRRLLSAALVVRSAAVASTGMASSFWAFVATRTVTGLGEAALAPAAMHLLANAFPPSSLGLAVGTYSAGEACGSAGLLLAGFAGSALGWRCCFGIVGAAGVLPAIGVLAIRGGARDPGGRAGSPGSLEEVLTSDQAAAEAATAPLAPHDPLERSRCPRCLRSRLLAAGLLTLGSACSTFASRASGFEQIWLVDERGLSKDGAAKYAGFVKLASGAVGALAGGVGSDVFCSRMRLSRLLFVAVALAGSLVAQLAYRMVVPTSWAFWPTAAVAMVLETAYAAPLLAALLELLRPEDRSRGAGVFVAANAAAAAAGSPVWGGVAQLLSSGGAARPYSTMLLLSLAAWLPALPCYAGAHRALRRERQGCLPLGTRVADAAGSAADHVGDMEAESHRRGEAEATGEIRESEAEHMQASERAQSLW